MVSLWDMLRFYADKFVEVLNILNQIESLMAQPEFLLKKNESLLSFYIDKLEQMEKHLEEMKLPVSAKQAFKLHRCLTNNCYDRLDIAGVVIKEYSVELRKRIEDELEGRTFFRAYPVVTHTHYI